VCILPDKGIRSHLVGTRLRVATLNLADTRRHMARTLQEHILRAGIPINLPTHQQVTLVMVHQCLVWSSLVLCVHYLILFIWVGFGVGISKSAMICYKKKSFTKITLIM